MRLDETDSLEMRLRHDRQSGNEARRDRQSGNEARRDSLEMRLDMTDSLEMRVDMTESRNEARHDRSLEMRLDVM